MLKHKAELILVIILIPILAYVIWQAYNTYFKPPSMDIEELEKAITEEIIEPPVQRISKQPPATKGTLDYTGYTERDPLRPPLPVREKIEKPAELPMPIERPTEKPAEKIKKELPEEITLPTFTVTGIVWGKESSRAIIDHQVYKIGDTIKEAKILDITERGIHMIYERKEFWVTVQQGG